MGEKDIIYEEGKETIIQKNLTPEKYEFEMEKEVYSQMCLYGICEYCNEFLTEERVCPNGC